MPVPVEKLIVPELPPSLTHGCAPMQTLENGTLTEILRVNGVNMENAHKCLTRHASIVSTLKELRETNGREP